MAERSEISWTDATFNPWIGCTKVSPACDHCYAERDMAIRRKRVEWGAGKARSRTGVANWNLPLRWNAKPFVQCEGCGSRGEGKPWQDFHPVSMGALDDGMACAACGSRDVEEARRRVFSASLADWLDNEVPIEWLVEFLDIVRRTPNLDWLLLTKRIGNCKRRIAEAVGYLDEKTPAAYPLPLRHWLANWLDGDAPESVWLGATVVDQGEADRDVPKLLEVPARVRFLSIEPMLGPIDLYRGGFSLLQPMHAPPRNGLRPERIHWVIAGGESGPNARPMLPGWVRSLRDQCDAAGVPMHFKQWGEWAPYDRGRSDGHYVADSPMHKFGKKLSGRFLDGSEHNGFPQ